MHSLSFIIFFLHFQCMNWESGIRNWLKFIDLQLTAFFFNIRTHSPFCRQKIFDNLFNNSNRYGEHKKMHYHLLSYSITNCYVQLYKMKRGTNWWQTGTFWNWKKKKKGYHLLSYSITNCYVLLYKMKRGIN